MRLGAPLVPPWLVGLWLLVTSESLWTPGTPTPGRAGSELAGGWVLLGALLIGTLAFLAAPRLGRNLAVSTVSSMHAGLGESNASQRAFGTGLVRAVSLAGLYLVVASYFVLESR